MTLTKLREINGILQTADPRIFAHLPKYREHKGDDYQEAKHQDPRHLQNIGDRHELQKKL